jgi:hypothetical protein
MTYNDEGDPTRNYHRNNPRSNEAHSKTNKDADFLRILTLFWQRQQEDIAAGRPERGLICDEAEIILGMSHQTCSARFSEMTLKKHWLILGVDADGNDVRRKTRANCWADVHFLSTPEESE